MSAQSRPSGWRRKLSLRPLACCCSALSAAVFLSVYLLTGWWTLLLSGLLLFLALAMLLRRHRLAGAVLLSATVGLWLVWLCFWRIQALEYRFAGQQLPLTVQAQEQAAPTSYGWEVDAIIREPAQLKGVHLRLYVSQEAPDVRSGDLLTGEVRLRSARGEQGVWELYNWSCGYLLTGSTKEVTTRPGALTPLLLPRRAAERVRHALGDCFGEEEAGFLLALTLGDRSRLSGELNQALSDTGLRHIVAASGLHVSVLVGAVLLLPGSRRRKSLVILPLLVFYAALAGFTPSITRAVVMHALLLLSPLVRRQWDAVTSLTVALAVILCVNPFAVASVSLQLSFGSMVGLFLLTPKLLPPPKRDARPRERAVRAVRTSLAMTLGAGCFTLPLVLYYFGSASVLSPVSNLVFLWLMPLLLPMGMVTALVGAVSPLLATPFAMVTGVLVRLAIRLILLLAKLPGPKLVPLPAVLAWILLAMAAALLIAADVLTPVRAGVVLLAAALLLSLLPRPSPALAEIQVLDVGQGQCILLNSGGAWAVIDCGSMQHRAGSALRRALDEQGCKRVSHLVLTHYDTDHINGLDDLFSGYGVDTVHLPVPIVEDVTVAALLSEEIQGYGAAVDMVNEPEECFTLGELQVRLTHIGSGENGGLAILVTLGQFDLLVTGDADTKAEAELMEEHSLPDVEVLVAGHHGSKYSTGEELLQAVRPEYVLISVGRNSYGHPTEEVLTRCAEAKAQVWRTDENGTLTVDCFGPEDNNFRLALAK